jgi:hypothetical protein
MPPRFLRQSEASLYEAGRVFMRLACTITGLFQGLHLPMLLRFLRQNEASLYEAGQVFTRLARTNTGLFQGLPVPCRLVFFVKTRQAFMRLGESLRGLPVPIPAFFKAYLYHAASFSSSKRGEPL